MNKRLNTAKIDALTAPTLPNPSQNEIARQHMLIAELFKRIDTLTSAMVKLGAMPVPGVVNNLPEMRVEVEGPEINIPAPIVNVEAPKVTVQAPNVTVEAPNVTVNPNVNVAAPKVTVESPAVNVAAPTVIMSPVYKWRLTHTLDSKGNVIETLAEAINE